MNVVKLSREGLRRFKALQPSTKFSDTIYPSEAGYSRVVFGEWKTPSRGSWLRNRISRKPRKLGVCVLTSPVGPVDCEFAPMDNVLTVLADEESVTPGWLEQASMRIVRDADLLSVSDLAMIASKFAHFDYLHLGLLKKIHEEIIYDFDKLTLNEISVILHVLDKFNIRSDKLFGKVVRLINNMQVGELSVPVDASCVCFIVCNLPKKFAKKVKLDTTQFESVSSAQLVAVAKKIGLTDRLCAVLQTAKLTDLQTCVELLNLKIDRPDLKNKLLSYSRDLQSHITDIQTRNLQAQLAATVLISTEDSELLEAFGPLITDKSVKGLYTHQLVGMRDFANIHVEAEIKRKFNSFSQRQKDIMQV